MLAWPHFRSTVKQPISCKFLAWKIIPQNQFCPIKSCQKVIWLHQTVFFCLFVVSLFTLAVWTPKNFFPLLTRPQGSQGCQKITFFFYKWNCCPFALRLPLKDTNFKNHQNWRKNVYVRFNFIYCKLTSESKQPDIFQGMFSMHVSILERVIGACIHT